MAPPGSQTWAWSLCLLLSWMAFDHVAASPQYLVAIPLILEAEGVSRICASLLKPNETLTMTVSLKSKELNITLMQMVSRQEFHMCREFEVPSIKKDEVKMLEVEVQGDTFYSRESQKVLVKRFKPASFIQTDKPIYIPGQTVHFRVISLDSMLRPSALLYNTIALEDPNGVRIAQWLNQTAEGKILQLSHKLNSEAAEGSYQIRVEADGEQTRRWFKVEKYVLPKFEITITSDAEVNILQDAFEVKVCAKYTYGQPVPGTAIVEVCRVLRRYYMGVNDPNNPLAGISEPCHKQRKQTNRNGCATFAVLMSHYTKLDNKVVNDRLKITADVAEEGTEVRLAQQKDVGISYTAGTLSFLDTHTVYRKGSPVRGKIKAVFYNNTPIANTPVYLFEGEVWSSRRLRNLTTDRNGVAAFSFCPGRLKGDLKGDLWLQASVTPKLQYIPYRAVHYRTERHLVSLLQDQSLNSKIISSLDLRAGTSPLPCGQEQDVTIVYTIAGEAEGEMDLIYLVLSRGNIVLQGAKKLTIEDHTVTEGAFIFKLQVSADMSPEVQVVAYAVLPSQGMIAHSAEFATEKCFSHIVSLEFSGSTALPGGQIGLQIRAEPNAVCGLSAVDRSVFVKEPERILNADNIFSLLPVKRHMSYMVQDPNPCLPVRMRRSILPRPEGQDDPYQVFQRNGLKMVTNLFIRMPSCLSFKGRNYHFGHFYRNEMHSPMMPVAERGQDSDDSDGDGGGGASPPAGSVIVTVRTFFPETWLWDMFETGASGTVDKVEKVPDTITTWEAETFCMSSQGFGLAPRADLKVFQPFFLELSLPYSIIRGERFDLKATVFNYLTRCIMLTVTPAESAHYQLVPLSGDQYTSCLCGNERKTVRWAMAVATLGVLEVSVTAEAVASPVSCNNEVVSVPDSGRIDRVQRTLIVKAEGLEMEQTNTWLLCPKGGELEEEATIDLPKNVIKGSAHGSVSVVGDVMGRALKNLEGQLRMPYGCGEQNMARLAPNIYILQYLEKTKQLTPAIREKALEFLRSGYQRQLNYRHISGAYSSFGVGEGNIWLTTFVLRSFAKAREYIYIDQSTMSTTENWLKKKQRENGCFELVGALFNRRMKGGVSDEVTLTAYITASFLEMNVPANDPMVGKSLSCLKASIDKDGFANIYTTTLMAYVFTLAGDVVTRTRLLNHLSSKAKAKGDLLYWEQTSGEDSPSLSVEISSYMVLAQLSANPTLEELGYATRIIRWISTQQNYYGGFYSTQDTVVALQALALSATLIFSTDGSTQVTVTSPSTSHLFMVTKDNKLLLQEKELKKIEGKHRLKATGTGCAVVQFSINYNVPTPNEVSTFSLEASESADCARTSMTLEITSRFTGRAASSNMVILDLKILSGFALDHGALESLGGPNKNRVELNNDHVLVYIPEMKKDKVVSHRVSLIQEFRVTGQKPAVIKIYDYYEPSNKAETEYTYPCSSG
ncbi:alpha-2-macroglobulin-like [Takifugu rubripes]|uniref:alpha-2-macroglobulin-like n=1 Tax=Takifugu rubripes TaxID=31033 RepID=UPI001145F5C8|nr:alpha-2-macroglobulin-like [Takifugu rubripes]